MKRAFMLVVTFLLFATGLITGPQQAMAATTPPPIAVIIIGCTATAGPPPTYTVTTVDTSFSSPTITLGTNCASAVATAKSSGFWIRRILGAAQDTSLVFVMVNSKDATD
jgi:glycerol uptake facilitator-like aquaporin